MKIYLAGPEVFFPNPMEEAACKKRVLAQLGHEGLFPLESDSKLIPIDFKPLR